MIFDLAILLLKVLGAVVLVIVAICVFHHLRAVLNMRRFAGQGMFSLPGNDTFLIGFPVGFKPYSETVIKEKAAIGENARHMMMWLLDQIDGADRSFDASKYPMIFANELSDVRLICSDPEVVNQVFNV